MTAASRAPTREGTYVRPQVQNTCASRRVVPSRKERADSPWDDIATAMHRKVMLIVRLVVDDESEPLIEVPCADVVREDAQPDRSPLLHAGNLVIYSFGTAWTSSSSCTCFPTRTPPVSIAMFQLTL